MTRKAIIHGMDEVTAGLAARLFLHGWTVSICNDGAAGRELFAEVLELARRSLPALRDFSILREGEIFFQKGEDLRPSECDLILFAASSGQPVRLSGAAAVCDARQGGDVDFPVSIHLMAPSYLLPLAEICGEGALADQVADLLESVGMKAVKTRGSRPQLPRVLLAFGSGGRPADIQAEMLDDILMHGPALLWAQQGMSGTSDPRSRDDALVAVLRALKPRNLAAGTILREADRRPPLQEDWSRPLKTLERVIPVDWTDYNGHMNESRYGHVFSDAGDTVMMMVGADQAYIDAGRSYFTVYNNITYLAETNAGDAVEVRTQVLQAEGKKLKMHHEMLHSDGRLLATCTQLLIHVSLETRRSCEPQPHVLEKLARMQVQQAKLPKPASLKE